jgi:hypothetical protein
MLEEFGCNIYFSWLKNLESVLNEENNLFVFYADNDFIADYIIKSYLDGAEKREKGQTIVIRKGIKHIVRDVFPDFTVKILSKKE